MAIEVLPDSPSFIMSPRISFSHNLPKNDAVPIEHHIQSTKSSSPIDFDFCVFHNHDYSSSADELFSDGKILPIQIKRKLPPPIKSAPPPPSPPPPPPQIEEEKQNAKTSSFWGFKRSASLNCGSSYARTLCPLPILSRSNSTGSNCGGAKQRSPLLNNQKRGFLKLGSANRTSSSASHQKPPLNKSGNASYGNRVKVAPVLNVPTSNLLGLIFSSGKNKGNKK